MDLSSTLDVSASALRAQSLRMRVIAENLANQDSTAATPGGDPYRRRVVTFQPEMKDGAAHVRVRSVATDPSQFVRVHQPGHPGADAAGYVLRPNVNGLVESADMRAAQRAYEANVGAVEAARSMAQRTIDLLK